MYFEALSAANPHGGGKPHSEDSIPLCVLLELCRLFKMEQECQRLMNSRNRTSFVDAYPSRSKSAIVSMLSIFSLLGTLGNALVLYVYVRKKNKIASTVFIICLAATDFMTSCIIMPFTMAMESLDYFIVYDVVCKVYFFLITCNVPFAAFIMVAIAVDRWLCICRPHCRLLNSRRSQIGIVFLAVVSAMFGVLTALFHGVYMTEKFSVDNQTQMVESIRNNLMKELYAGVNVSAFCSQYGDPDCEEATRNATAVVESLTEVQIARCLRAEDRTIFYTGQCQFNEVIFSTAFRKTYQKVYASMFLVCFIVVFLLYIAIYRSVIVRRARRLRARQKNSSRLVQDVSLTDTQNSTSRAEASLRKKAVGADPASQKKKNVSGVAESSKKASKDQTTSLNKNAAVDEALLQKNTSGEAALLTTACPDQVSIQALAASASSTTLNNGWLELNKMAKGRRGDRARSSPEAFVDNALKEKYLVANVRTAVMLFVVTVVFVMAFLPSWLMAHDVVMFHAVVFYCYFAYNVCNPIIYAFMNPTFRKELQDLLSCRAVRGRGGHHK